MTSTEDFTRLADPYRRELLVHCYRMLGSVHDAEDTVQETYLQAWRAYDGFEGRSSLRTWLYRIATRACLKALERGRRRPLPHGLGGPPGDPAEPLAEPSGEILWLEPFPTPAQAVDERQTTRLALIAALQHLQPRQRAVLIMRDVLMWRANEVADLLDISTAAVNSLLQRARAHVGDLSQDDVVEPADPIAISTVERLMKAFENSDNAGLMRLLTDDAVWEMPPIPTWFTGPGDIGRFLASLWCVAPENVKFVRTTANDQPAIAWWQRHHEGGPYQAHCIQVLTVTARGIIHAVSFMDPSLFPVFGLPPTK
ncbi:RNA polymerase subunit sigma-70 [Actinosynnema sp. ALI-1.44]|uniref:sigma-70 family RNA polymerase sigma factor n=1 Tax=Actinosynnema sp. ALI-1.44 TaxID=1933779 RepID=UPI00097C0934|nr:sigma-70 family RNA polymerase sigma factor [Actinosynnema sp. ALI-1.44]ONI81211.1 RNA polymerase subunit sigma-70 [Actinosynnema sp. ALI-1.44]